MRIACALLIVSFCASGCAAYTERQSLGYGNYVAYSCEQLGYEAVRLMKEVGDRSQHLFEDDQSRRETAMAQLKAVKQASSTKNC
jgi:hypothetical protein